MDKNILIGIDRDKTINHDNKYYLGRQKDWKSKIKILPHVIKGLKLLNKELPKAKLYMITNQRGVSIKDFPLLTEKRANEVCRYIMRKLREKGVKMHGYEACTRADPGYPKTHPKFKFDKKLIGNFSYIKPKPGMIYNAIKKQKWKKLNTKVYMIGDRECDVKAGLNAKGFGILVPFDNNLKQKTKARKLKQKHKNVYIAKNFLDAAKFIIKNEDKN